MDLNPRMPILSFKGSRAPSTHHTCTYGIASEKGFWVTTIHRAVLLHKPPRKNGSCTKMLPQSGATPNRSNGRFACAGEVPSRLWPELFWISWTLLGGNRWNKYLSSLQFETATKQAARICTWPKRRSGTRTNAIAVGYSTLLASKSIPILHREGGEEKRTADRTGLLKDRQAWNKAG